MNKFANMNWTEKYNIYCYCLKGPLMFKKSFNVKHPSNTFQKYVGGGVQY